MRASKNSIRSLFAALAVILMATPSGRPADAAVPLYQAYQIGGWFICGGWCHGGYCCQIVPKPPIDDEE